MLLEEMIEYIRKPFPQLSESEIVRLLNRASDDFSKKTEIIKDTVSVAITSDTRYYSLSNIYSLIKNISIEESDGKMTEVSRTSSWPIKGA